MSMLRSALARGYRGRITFVHFARTPADVIFASELRSLAHVHPNLKLVIETESERGSLPDLTADSLAAIVPDFAAWDAWVCGPAPLMDAARRIYAAQGAADKLRTEQFVLATPNVLDNQAGQVAFARAKKSLTGDARTLLEQAEASGIDGRRGCGMGICMSCRCKKLSGVTRNLRTGQLSTDENEEIQLCISVPVGDVTIDL